MGKKTIVSVTYENERISIKNSLPYLKCVLRLPCVVHGPIYGRFGIQTTKLSILLRFYFHGVLEQLKTNFQTNFRFKRVLAWFCNRVRFNF